MLDPANHRQGTRGRDHRDDRRQRSRGDLGIDCQRPDGGGAHRRGGRVGNRSGLAGMEPLQVASASGSRASRRGDHTRSRDGAVCRARDQHRGDSRGATCDFTAIVLLPLSGRGSEWHPLPPMGLSERVRGSGTTPALFNLPLIGRAPELSMLSQALANTAAGRGCAVILAGEGGIGKTRLAKAAVEQAERRHWQVALGRAYPVETGVPYALFSDALLPILRKLDGSSLQVLTRGGSAELAYLFPALVPAQERMSSSVARGDPAEFKARLLWNFTQFLVRLSAKQPIVLVLENLQWADAASLELLHFIARQISQEKLLLLCTYNATERDLNPTLRTTEQSLVALGAAQVHHLRPLTREATEDLIHEVFGTEKGATREFSALLYGWTRGNPCFIEETLKALVESGQLHERDGTWLGWELDTLQLPRSIREAVIARVDRLSPNARTIANLAAVIGTRATYEQLAAVSSLSSSELLAAIDELRRQRVLSESEDGEAIAYDFTHPALQDALYG